MPIKRPRTRINTSLTNSSFMVVMLAVIIMALLPSWQIIYDDSQCIIGKSKALEDFENEEIGDFVRAYNDEIYLCGMFFCGTGTGIEWNLYCNSEAAENCYWQTIDSLKEANAIDTTSQIVQIPVRDSITCGGSPTIPIGPIATFEGGDSMLIEFINSNIIYPKNAVRDSIEGTVFVKCYLDTSMNITNIEILRSVRSDLDSVATQAVLKTSGHWISAQHKGKKLCSTFVLPITFKLE